VFSTTGEDSEVLLTRFLFRTGLLNVAGLQLKNKNMSPWPNLTGMTNILLQFIALAQVVSVYMLDGVYSLSKLSANA